MHFTLRSRENVTIFELDGRVDTSTVPSLYESFHQASNTHPAQVVVDLAKVNFLDSSGLAILIRSMKSCREKGGDLYLCSPQQPIRMILELTKLNETLEIFPNEAEAVASFVH